MKKYITGILIFALILTLIGCNSVTTTNDVEKYEMIEVEDISVLADDLKEQIEKLSNVRGYYLLENEDEGALLFISLGEKPTAGFEISNHKVTSESGLINITFEEVGPKEMAAQVISYPYKIYKLNNSVKDPTKLIIKNQAGEQFNLINLENIDENNLSYIKGQYVGQIDGHSVEIIVDGQPKAFQIGEVEELFNSFNLYDGQPIEIAYEENENEQLILKDIRVSEGTTEVIKIGDGRYIGQIDPHSIEVEIDDTIKAFQITEVIDQFNALDLQEGDMIRITYIDNVSLVIKSIEKIEE